jgi:hypothetical protein
MDQTDFSNPSNNSTFYAFFNYLFIYLVMYLYSISFFHYNFLQLNSVKLIMIFYDIHTRCVLNLAHCSEYKKIGEYSKSAYSKEKKTIT